jgi:hypothetical protein
MARDPRQPLPGKDAVDLFDGASEAATERELAWMWLADLGSRVAELEALLGVEPGQMDIGNRVAELEALAEYLPVLYELREMARLRDQRRPLL